MGARTILFGDHEYYHIYNRGVEKRIIYHDDSDKQRFLDLLYLANTTDGINYRDIKSVSDSVYEYERQSPLVSIGAYCLMPNHFHLLIRAKEGSQVNKFMNKLGTSYSMYFNKKYDRTGALFQGRYKAKHADSDEYLKYLFSYIHLNPIKLVDSSSPEDRPREDDFLNTRKTYRWSSLRDYLGEIREEGKILDKVAFPDYFTKQTDLLSELNYWIKLPEGDSRDSCSKPPRGRS